MSIKKDSLTQIFNYMLNARAMDVIEQEYTARGEAFFHVSGRGHEGISVLHAFLDSNDWVHAHYRDKSLLLARGVTTYDYFLALFNKDESHSRGRQMNSHMSGPNCNVLSLVGPVGNSQSQAAGIAATLKEKYQANPSAFKHQPIVYGGVGDGTTNQGEFLEGLTVSIRDSLPLLTVVQDNNFAISTFTKGKTFYQLGDKQIDHFMGCPIIRIDGRNPHIAYDEFEKVITTIREKCEPRIVIFEVDRLDSHTNADDQKIYRTSQEIEQVRKSSDPLVKLLTYLFDEDEDKASERLQKELDALIPELKKEVSKAQLAREPEPIFTAKAPLPKIIDELATESSEPGDDTMILAIRHVLDEWLNKDERVFLYGEDLEDPKGDVFGVTKGLSTNYPGRVVNSPLAESLILGYCGGRALAGQIPVAFLQFGDFFPLAFNQIYSELGTMWWRTDGSWKSHMIVMATSGGYKPGLGPFHAASMEAVAAHVPGIDVFAPSNATDAAGLLNAAFMSGRPTIFFYPKNLLNTKTRNISEKSARKFVIKPGVASILEEGKDITMVGYGNTIPLCEKAVAALKQFGKSVDLIDIRTISPLDHDTIIQSVKKTGRLLVTHEENNSMGVGAEILARVGSACDSVNMKRVTRKDTFIPCNFANQLEVLPSYKEILETAVDMIGGNISWEKSFQEEEGITAIEAVGSSPSDETLTIIEWKIAKGDSIQAGELIAEAEANKAEVNIKSLVTGTVKELLIDEGDTVNIGDIIALIQTEEKVFKTITREDPGTPTIEWHEIVQSDMATNLNTNVYIGYTSTVLGSKIVSNDDIVTMSPEWNAQSIVASTGIESRHWLGDEQSLVSLSTDAARKTLEKAGLKITDIQGIICATGTHKYLTPSLAAMVQYELTKDMSEAEIDAYDGYAYDVSAACSGFVYALASAYNQVILHPQDKILLLTGEVLSDRTDMTDYPTAPVFSDAASASIVSLEEMSDSAVVYRPLLQTVGEPAKDLIVPGVGYIHMDGIEVYKVAVHYLQRIAEKVCRINKVNINDIDLIIPHQANIKIIKGIARRMKLDMKKFYVNIDRHGNSSSNTIPICLDELIQEDALKGKKVLVVAFGGGFTFGGTILQY